MAARFCSSSHPPVVSSAPWTPQLDPGEVLRKPKTTVRQTTYCRVGLLLRSKLVVQKIYWEKRVRTQSKIQRGGIKEGKENMRTDSGNPIGINSTSGTSGTQKEANWK